MAISTSIVPQTTPTAMYTSTGDTAITFATFTNYGTGASSLTIYIVPDGASPVDGNMLIDAESILEGDTFSMYLGSEKLLLSDGDTIQAFSDNATSVNAIFSYTSI